MTTIQCNHFDFHYNLTYNPGKPVTLHLIVPRAVSAPRPLLILVHGGGWRTGKKEGMLQLALDVAAHGFACATISYTLSDVAPFPAAIQDVKTAIRFLRSVAEEYGLDPERFAGLGCSAGAHLISLAALAGPEAGWDDGAYAGYPSTLQAFIDICGPTDFPSFTRFCLNGDVPPAENPYFQFLDYGKPGFEERERLASPLTHVKSGAPPALVIHGQEDPIVPFAQAETFVEALNNAGVCAQLVSYPQTDHGVLYVHYEKNVPLIVNFLQETLNL